MPEPEQAAQIAVVVAYSPGPREIDLSELVLAAGATLHDALRASGVLERHPGIDLATHKVGIWGRVRALDAPLREGDRVEVYRPLKVDPKEARRQRYRGHRDKARGR
ncbi:MAG TPA: RnfH family protein [Albitalea sp.]|uniref:RnfH family protein n=1 Tax=Piscinibacter sp. TaxID=1903157 RepID=UPI002ED10A39